MSIVPSRIQDLVEWADVHATVFTTNAVNIGLTVPQASSFSTFAGKVKSKYTAVLAARQSLRAATVEQSTAVSDFRRSAADTLALIKAFAENAPVPNTVYNLAQIPPPSVRQPLPPPGMPEMIRAELNNTGAITLRWRCENPQGSGSVVYTVRRSFDPAAPVETFPIIGATGERAFIDTGIPSGTTTVQYVITAQRGSAMGPTSETFVVRFGSAGGGGGGFAIVSQGVGSGTQVKMAA